MTQEHAHHPSGPLELAVALGAIAGFIDAHIYVNVTPVFVANMSGNLIHFGIFTGLAGWSDATGSALAIAAFLCAVIAATAHHDRQVNQGREVRPDFLLAVEAGLVLMLPVLLTLLHVRFTAHSVVADYPVIVVGAFAMGLQTSALRRVGAVAVATTYGTGAIVRIGEKIVLALRGADRATSHRRRVTILILVSVLLSYVLGAVFAASIGSSPALLLIPGLVLLIAAGVARRQPA